MQYQLQARPLLGQPFHPDPLLDRLYRARGVSSMAQLDHRLAALPAPQFADIDAATTVLREAIERQQRIVIIADYDCDGATACAVAVRGLRALGAADVRYLVPDRFSLGYGLSPAIAELIAPQQADVVLTVDNGISSIEGAAAVQALPAKLLITDHHLPGESLPVAQAIVNPNRRDCAFPSKALAGVGVIFYVLLALRRTLGSTVDLRPLLDLVALGTVADVVPLDQTNRILIEQGLRRIRAGQAHAGVQALFAISAREAARSSPQDLGFAIAPRLNAAGRMDDMSLGVQCLLCDDPATARELAQSLHEINEVRRATQDEMIDDALSDLGPNPDQAHPHGVCLFNENFHEGIVGLVAGRLRERYQRPAVVFARGVNGDLKGSARSVPGVHLRDVLADIATCSGAVSKFGGHAMAAGLSLAEQDYDVFAQHWHAQMARVHPQQHAVLDTDGELESQFFTVEVAERLGCAGPWGTQFEAPCFEGVFVVQAQRILKGRHLKLQLQCHDGSHVDAIWFGQPSTVANTMRLVFALEVNHWRGRSALQLLVRYGESA